MRRMKIILICLSLSVCHIVLNAAHSVAPSASFITPSAPSALPSTPPVIPSEVEESVNVSEMLFGHIGDSYGWHITDWNGSHITIPLPCIVCSKTTGWHAFMSSKIEHGHSYMGFSLAEEGRYKDK